MAETRKLSAILVLDVVGYSGLAGEAAEDVYWQGRSRLNLTGTDLGSTILKNIAEPVTIGSGVRATTLSMPDANGDLHDR